MAEIEGHESPEMYLKAIYLIRKEKNYCRHIDVAHRLGVTSASVSVAVNNLREEDCVTVDEDGMIVLTEKGLARAQMVYDKFCFWKDVLEKFGVDPQTAEDEACKFEHALSDEAFLQIKQATEKNSKS